MIELAYAADQAAGAGSTLGAMMPLILIIVAFWFLIMRPQQQRYKQHQAMLKELKRGDQVITSSGIIGKITKVTDDIVHVEIADNVEIQMKKEQVGTLYDPAAEAMQRAAAAKKETTDKKTDKK